MDREEMIEKIARIICEHQTIDDCSCPDPQRVACTAYNKAKDILTSIIPDGAVVLTREEMETTDKIPQKIKGFYKWFIEIEKEQSRKETVREIFKRICNVEYSIYDDAYGYANALVCEFEKIFKEHGLEVEE